MKLYLLFFLFSFVSTQSYEKFIKIAVGPKKITCNDNYFFVTNHTEYLNCNERQYCRIANKKLSYVCVKKRFMKSSCQRLMHDSTISQDGCFIGNYQATAEFHISNTYTKFFHFVVLENKLGYKWEHSSLKHCNAFCYKRCDQSVQTSVQKNGWILVKVSNNSKEDFREFFSDDPPSTSPPSRKEPDGTTTIEGSSSATKEPDGTTTIEGSSSATKEPDDTTTTEDCSFVIKVGLILSAVVNILLIISLVTYCFYRKNLQKAKTIENSNGIPLRNNGTFNQIPSGRESDIPVYISLCGINQLDERSQPETPRSPSQTNKPAQNCEDAFYANVTKQKDGVVTNRKNLPKTKTTENSKDIPSSENGTFNQIPSGRESENPQYMSMYGINQLDERSQPETPRSPSQTNKPAQNCEDAFYANVTKQDGGPVTAGGQSHVVVNGDVYPTVNKDESYYENSARLDNLARE